MLFFLNSVVCQRARAPRCRTELTLSWYNLRMSKTVTTLDQDSSVALPPEALDALGIEAGAELEVEIVGRALVVRSVEEARRSAEFISTFESILSKRRTAYEELRRVLTNNTGNVIPGTSLIHERHL